jgi:ferredoxin
MPKIEINGQTVEGFTDESLLGMARRYNAHIGYACGGHGLCQTCEVIVDTGAFALSEVTDVEKAWLNTDKLQQGHRLACQAHIAKDEPIKFTTRAEKARRLFNKAFVVDKQLLPPTSHPQGHVGEFFTFLGLETIGHTLAAPMALGNALGRVSDGRLKLDSVNDLINAWNERLPEIQEFVGKAVSGVPEAVGPVANALADLTKVVVDTVGNISRTTSTVTPSVSGQAKAVTIKIEKKVTEI